MKILFSEMDAAASIVAGDISCFEEEGLPVEAFAKVQEIFSYVDWLDPKADVALNVLQQMSASNIVHENLDNSYHEFVETSALLQVMSPRKLRQKKNPTFLENNDKSSLSSFLDIQSIPSPKRSPGTNLSGKMAEPHDIQIAVQLPSQSDIMFQGMHQSSQSTRVSCKSVQGAPVTPTFGIECQLHDCALSESAKVTHQVSVSPTVPAPTLAVSHVPESVDTKSVSIAPETPPPAPPPRPLLIDCSTKTLPSPSPPPPLPLPRLSEPTHFSLTNNIYSKDHSSMASPPAAPRTPFSSTATNNLFRDSPPPTPTLKENLAVRVRPPPPPPPPPHTGQTAGPVVSSNNSLLNPPSAPAVTSTTRPPPPPPTLPPPPTPPLNNNIAVRAGHPPPPPLPHSGQAGGPRIPSSVPPPPPDPASVKSLPVPSVPPPPAPFVKGVLKTGDGNSSPSGGKGRILSRTISSKNHQTKKLRPLHWLKLTRALSGSLWAEAQKFGDAAKYVPFS